MPATDWVIGDTCCRDWEDIIQLPLEDITSSPSFVFMWVGTGEGLENGRRAFHKWGFRRMYGHPPSPQAAQRTLAHRYGMRELMATSLLRHILASSARRLSTALVACACHPAGRSRDRAWLWFEGLVRHTFVYAARTSAGSRPTRRRRARRATSATPRPSWCGPRNTASWVCSRPTPSRLPPFQTRHLPDTPPLARLPVEGSS
jgi:hypothetical protein